MIQDGRNNLFLTYNNLNLIEKVEQDNVNLANYSYLADGTKLAATNVAGNGLIYMGSLVYRLQNNALMLESSSFSDGRILNTTNGYDTQYHLTDHLGSIRTIVDDDGDIIEQNDYYPYGSRWNAPNQLVSDNRYRYNGQEDQSFLNIPYTDYGARMYDSNLGKWFNIDPLSEKYYSLSPSIYCANNPIKYIDPKGEAWYFNEYGIYLGQDEIDNGQIRIMPQCVWDINAIEIDGVMTIESIIGESASALFSHESNIMRDGSILNIYQFINDFWEISSAPLVLDTSLDKGVLMQTQMIRYNENPTFHEIQIAINHSLEGFLKYGLCDNIYNIASIFIHERQHVLDGWQMGYNAYNNLGKNIQEIRAYETQIFNNPFWFSISPRLQILLVKGYYNSLSKNE